jgi:UDP-glucose:(heptosyl)LPS alpha-1,3-glucosyltransferase
MKIALIRQNYTPNGGAERYAQAIAQGMAARGHEVHLLARSWPVAGAAGCQFRRVPTVNFSSSLRTLSFALACRRMLAREKFDLVFSLERTLDQDVYRAGDGCHREWLAQRAPHRSRLQRAGELFNVHHHLVRGLERRIFSPRHTRLVIANSRRGRDEIIRHFGFPDDRIRVIYNGVDCERFHPPAARHAGREVRLLFVGSSFARKGLQFAIAALARLPEHFVLHIAGKGDIARQLRLAGTLGVTARVRHLGFNLDTARLLQSADLLVHPAIYEPFANVCLEALASGVPVVTSRINGVSEIIEPGRNGAVVESPNDAAELAAAIRLFETHPARTEASRAARATAERFEVSRHVSQTLTALEGVLAAKLADQPVSFAESLCQTAALR